MKQDMHTRALTSGLLLTVSLFIMFILAGSLAQPGVADNGSGNISIDRTGDNLSIVINESQLSENSTVRVRVNGELLGEYSDNASKEFDLLNTGIPELKHENLSSADVNVRIINESSGNTTKTVEETLSLAAISFTNKNTAEIKNNTLTITANNHFGISDGQTVPLQLSGERESSIEAEAMRNNNILRFEINSTNVSNYVNIYTKFNITAFPRVEAETTKRISPLSERSDKVKITREGNSVKIDYKQLIEDLDYAIKIETEKPEGTLTLSRSADDSSLRLPPQASTVFAAEKVNILIKYPAGSPGRESQIVVQDEDASSFPPTREVNATIGPDQLNITDKIDWGMVDMIWFEYNDKIERFSSEQINGSPGKFDVSAIESDIDAKENATMILFDNNAITERLNIVIADSPDSSESPALLLTLLWIGAGLLLATGSVYTYSQKIPIFGEIIFIFWAIVSYFIMSVISYLTPLGTGFIIGLVGTVALPGILLTMIQKMSWDKLLISMLAVFVTSTVFTLIAVITPSGFIIPSGGSISFFIGSGYTVATVAVLSLLEDEGRDQKRGQTARSSRTQPVNVTVTIIDAVTGKNISSVNRVTAKQQAGKRERLSINDGVATGSLLPGTWVFSVETSVGRQEVRNKVQRHRNSIQIELPGVRKNINIQDTNGEPIPNADLTVESPNYTETGSTNQQGEYVTTVPANTEVIDVSAEHQIYQQTSKSMNVSREDATTLVLTQRTGQLRVTASLGQNTVSGLSVMATRQGQPELTVSGTTDERGIIEFPELTIGRYNLDADLSVNSGAFTVTAGTATINEEQITQKGINIRFDYNLPEIHKRRIRTLRSELEDIAHSTRRDDVIQGYYVSVLHAILDEIEQVPQSGYHFLEHGQDPDSVVTALIDATEELITGMDKVLSSQRNVNLFSACSELPDANVKWQGNADISDLLQNATQRVGQQRAKINTQLTEVDRRITSELQDLAEVSPAREMWDEVQRTLQDQGGLNETEVAASIFVAQLVLDAIESVFEREKLRRRLEQTVY